MMMIEELCEDYRHMCKQLNVKRTIKPTVGMPLQASVYTVHVPSKFPCISLYHLPTCSLS